MREILITLPLLIPLVIAMILVLFWNKLPWQRLVTILGASLYLAAVLALLFCIQRDGIQAVQIGNWPPPFGITFVVDLFSAILLATTGVIVLAVAIYSLGNIDSRRSAFGYYPLFFVLVMGISGSFLTGDMFNLYVWFEVMLIASFVLTALGGERAQMEGALKYVTLNLISSSIFLAAVGTLYGVAGTLNMADLAIALPSLNHALITTLAMMFLVAFGLKAAIFPLFFWLPAAYHTPPAAVSAIFAGLLTKVGVYALVRVFTLMFVYETAFTQSVIFVLTALTMLIGIMGAISQRDFRRVLSFNLISHIGFMLFGFAISTPLALAGMIFYIIHHMIVMTTLFLGGGLVYLLGGTYRLEKLGGLYRSQPMVAFLFFIPAISLAGLPPFSGFWPKLAIFQAGLGEQEYIMIAVAVIMSFLTLYSMIKIWNQAFWKAAPEDPPASPKDIPSWKLQVAPVLMLTLLIVALGLMPEPVFQLAEKAANQILTPLEYINIVFGGGS
ncbi:Na+/H+ antiporter subunit D [Chloroflexota bacterium]